MVIKNICSLGPSRRAVNADQKDLRRGDILTAAATLFERTPYEAITMSHVATAAGVAKGTLYLYFPTREALFLHLLGQHYAGWFDALDARLRQPHLSAQVWAEWVAHELVARPLFLRLVAILHVVLERNVPLPEVLVFKRQLASRVATSGAELERALDLPPAGGGRLLLWLQAVVPGLAQMATPPAPLRAAIEADPQLAGLLVDFTTELRALLAAVVHGLQGTKGTPE
ncbi:MAG: TetR family transcriptional regulator [Rhodanobacter sp.]|jgi:AcrR family transcriptional regulator|nr:TetR family transcriptional regulator [Rhodanobacter sp.]